MNLKYNQILERANVILKDKVEKKYKESHPDLDLGLVIVDLETSVASMFEALVEAINQAK